MSQVRNNADVMFPCSDILRVKYRQKPQLSSSHPMVRRLQLVTEQIKLNELFARIQISFSSADIGACPLNCCLCVGKTLKPRCTIIFLGQFSMCALKSITPSISREIVWTMHVSIKKLYSNPVGGIKH